MPEPLPKRKSPRLPEYDYNSPGAYFVTICTRDRMQILSKISANPVGAYDSVRPEIILTQIGKIVEQCWNNINSLYDNVQTDKFVIMPDHFHGIIHLRETSGGQSRPPLSKIIQGFKSVTTRMCFDFGYRQIWQRSFAEHIIRNDEDFLTRWNYIDENPGKWLAKNKPSLFD